MIGMNISKQGIVSLLLGIDSQHRRWANTFCHIHLETITFLEANHNQRLNDIPSPTTTNFRFKSGRFDEDGTLSIERSLKDVVPSFRKAQKLRSTRGVNHVVVSASCRHHHRQRGGRRGACSGQITAQKVTSAMDGCHLPYVLQAFLR